MLRYKIAELLNNLPVKEYDEKKSDLIAKLGVSRSTFNEWIKLTTKDKRDIGVMHLITIADFFKTDIKDLINDKSLNIKRKKTSNIQNK